MSSCSDSEDVDVLPYNYRLTLPIRRDRQKSKSTVMHRQKSRKLDKQQSSEWIKYTPPRRTTKQRIPPPPPKKLKQSPQKKRYSSYEHHKITWNPSSSSLSSSCSSTSSTGTSISPSRRRSRQYKTVPNLMLLQQTHQPPVWMFDSNSTIVQKKTNRRRRKVLSSILIALFFITTIVIHHRFSPLHDITLQVQSVHYHYNKKIHQDERKEEHSKPRLVAFISSNHQTNARYRRRSIQPSSLTHAKLGRQIELYPSNYSDVTQLYGILDSSDPKLEQMELREPYADGECVPMKEWQTSYHPTCTALHEINLSSPSDDSSEGSIGSHSIELFGVKGFWRNAWKISDIKDSRMMINRKEQPPFVLKTLKYEHNFEDAHFEHDRVDAVAMEMLTSSPHVINVYGFCGHSVLTEYADGSSVGKLADKARKDKVKLLKLAVTVAKGLADVHGIDNDGLGKNNTFVHLDINPANVVSIGGTLKYNDFNIGIMRRWNTTSHSTCTFPTQYPNPQWRSPEEALGSQNLDEKVDVFSMGHILFRLICGHEPWNKLEIGGKPSKEEINEKVQKGVLPHVPEEIRKSKDKVIVAIREAMFKCYTFDPKERPSAKQIADDLEKKLKSMRS